MSRYIDADALVKESNDWFSMYRTKSDGARNSVYRFVYIEVRNRKGADVKPVVRGKWTDTTHGLMCSACETYQVYGSRFYNFCPICGADMKEVEE